MQAAEFVADLVKHLSVCLKPRTLVRSEHVLRCLSELLQGDGSVYMLKFVPEAVIFQVFWYFACCCP